MILDVGSNLRSLQSINSHTVESESATYYGPIVFFCRDVTHCVNYLLKKSRTEIK